MSKIVWDTCMLHCWFSLCQCAGSLLFNYFQILAIILYLELSCSFHSMDVCVCVSRSHLWCGYDRGPCSSLPGLQKWWFAETLTEIWGGKKSVSYAWHCVVLKICTVHVCLRVRACVACEGRTITWMKCVVIAEVTGASFELFW